MSSTTDSVAVSIQELSYSVGQFSLLHPISCVFKKARVTGVIGPNGAGKTTLLKLLSGQLKSSNSILLNQRPIEQYSLNALAKQVAVVNQLHRAVTDLAVQRIVAMGLMPHQSLFSKTTQAQHDKVHWALQQVGLSNKLYASFGTLSGGEQQRVLIAQALVQGSPLFVLDEPVNHLDIYYQHQILMLLQNLAQQHAITVVVSLHDLNLAAYYCDELILLNKGRLEASGKPEQVLTASQIASTFNLPCKVSRAQGANKIHLEFSPPVNAKVCL